MDKEALLEELKNNPKCIAYLSQFTEESAKIFLEHYASEKMIILSQGKFMRDNKHSNETYFRGRADEFYWQIAQKKLFNLQCQWRAGQIDLPVKISMEFHYWERNIKSCPFNDPVTEEDIAVMLRYLNRPFKDVVDHWFFEEWQNYEDFKDESGMGIGDAYPDWYEFYDNQMGTQVLLTLPDIRGAEEERYMDAWRAEKFKDYKEPPPPDKPTIISDSETTLDFIKAVEPYKILDLYRSYSELREDADTYSSLDELWEILSNEEEEVIVPEGPFPTVLYEAVYRLEARKMERFLPVIREEHIEMQAMGIGYELDCSLEEDTIVKMLSEGIKRGKELLGEE